MTYDAHRRSTLRLVIAGAIPAFLLAMHYLLWPGQVAALNWGEPDYGYIFNSADIRFGAPPGHTDHPGTTVQSLGVAVFVGAEALRAHLPGFPGWYDDFLLHPGLYHFYNSLALAVIAALGLWAMGVALLRHGHGLGLVIALQLLTFLQYNSWHYIPRVSPEKLLFFLNCAFAGYLATREGEGRRRAGFALMLGFLLGFAVATKYNCLTLAGFLLLAPSVPLFLLAGTAAALCFFFFTLPMAEVYTMSFQWLGRITSHQGMYGAGEKGMIPGFDSLRENFFLLANEDSAFLAACLVALPVAVTLAWRRRSRDCLVAAVILVAHFAMVLKHPASRYLIPMGAPLLLIAFHALRGLPRLLPWVAAGLVLPAVLHALEAPILTVWGAQGQAPVQLRLDTFAEKHRDCHWAFVSPVSRPEWALSAGNGSAFRRHTADLLRHYPEALSYDVSPPRFHRFSVQLPLAVVAEKVRDGKGCLYLGGISYETAQERLRQAPFRYEVFHHEVNGMYVLKVRNFPAGR